MKTIQRFYIYGNKSGVQYFKDIEQLQAVMAYIEAVRVSDINEYVSFGLEWIKENAEATINNMGATDIASYQHGIYKVNTTDIDYSFRNEVQNRTIKDIADIIGKFV